MQHPTASYAFRRLERADMPLIARWLAERHVAKWWGRKDNELAEIVKHVEGDDVEPMIVTHDAVPIGYLQTYPTTTDPDVPAQPSGTLGVDYLIGEVSALGRGHGAAFLRRFADVAHTRGVPRLVSDPDGRNITSVGCLGRAGFQPACMIGPPSALRLLMARDLIPTSLPDSRPAARPTRRRRTR